MAGQVLEMKRWCGIMLEFSEMEKQSALLALISDMIYQTLMEIATALISFVLQVDQIKAEIMH